MKKWPKYLIFELFSNRKWHGLSPWLVDQRQAWSMVDRPPWPAVELTRARPSGRSGPRRFAVRWGKEGGRHRESNLANIESWKAVGRRHISGGTSTQKGGGVGVGRAKRKKRWRCGVFTKVGADFYGAEARQGRPGAFKVPVTGD
jgi:hypothetical protein